MVLTPCWNLCCAWRYSAGLGTFTLRKLVYFNQAGPCLWTQLHGGIRLGPAPSCWCIGAEVRIRSAFFPQGFPQWTSVRSAVEVFSRGVDYVRGGVSACFFVILYSETYPPFFQSSTLLSLSANQSYFCYLRIAGAESRSVTNTR